ncbi:MAG TPA: oxygenase MpaB family protein [Thermoanaerobaculia bacterium]|nr:oxygenase MpaB family protein [Thermoanaerobaculia bacterium]
MQATQWSDDGFLDGLRRQGDPLADGAVERLIRERDISEVNRLFQMMRSDDQPLPPDLPAPLQELVDRTNALPAGVDLERVRRGEAVYMRHAFTGALVLLAKSLPEGYQAPCLTEILMISRDLARNPYDRLLGVLQMLVRVCSVHGFEPAGAVILTAQKMRLLHAGIRTIVPRHRRHYEERYGVPVNHEDMLATLMAFSYLVIDGLRRLNVGLSDADAEDLYYLWQVFARMVGIHPVDDPDSTAYIPQDLAQAAEFYAAYARRHYVEAAHNPGGGILAQDNLKMLQDRIPRLLGWLGLRTMPRIYMWDLMGPATCGRLGIAPVAGHSFLKWLLLKAVRSGQRAADHLPAKGVEAFSQLVFQGLINQQYGGQVEFLIPDSIATLHRLAPEKG